MYIKKKSFLEINPEYQIVYNQFLKDARTWNGMGQYWLGKESNNRASSLLNGNLEEALKPIKSENLYSYF
jgi:hypothetical protein